MRKTFEEANAAEFARIDRATQAGYRQALDPNLGFYFGGSVALAFFVAALVISALRQRRSSNGN